MAKSIIIIEPGWVHVCGIYGQMNGYETQIFEMHTKPGGNVHRGSARATPSTPAFITSSAVDQDPA